MTTENANPRHLARSLQRLYTTTRRQAQKGLNAENSRRLQLEGEIFLLTFPFIELQGGPLVRVPEDQAAKSVSGGPFVEKKNSRKSRPRVK